MPGDQHPAGHDPREPAAQGGGGGGAALPGPVRQDFGAVPGENKERQVSRHDACYCGPIVRGRTRNAVRR